MDKSVRKVFAARIVNNSAPERNRISNDVNALDIEVYYSLGGMNLWNDRNEPRGFYLSVTPMEHKGIMRGYIAGTGGKMFLLETSRFSAAGMKKACVLADKVLNTFAKQICDKYGLESSMGRILE